MLKGIDKGIFYTTLILIFLGFFIFFSASLPFLKDQNFFNSIILKQFFSIIIGLVILFFILKSKKINSVWLRKNSILIFAFFSILQLLVLLPGLGLKFKGGQRWLDLGLFSIQPSEFFKYAFIIFFTAVVVALGKKIEKFKTFLILGSSIFPAIILFFIYIKDLGSLLAILVASFIILLLSKIKYRFLFLTIFTFILIFLPLLYFSSTYIQKRIDVYLKPDQANILKEGYQINEMAITLGSGEIWGRGYGSSLQKYSGLIPEPFGDSIFAVFGEEFGFAGSSVLVFLFLLLFYFIVHLAKEQKNIFDKSLIIALGTLIVFPAFYNIGVVVSLMPLSGMPITFVSKGGTAMVAAIIAVALILKIGKRRK